MHDAADIIRQPVKIESVKAGEYNTLMMVKLDGNPYEKEGEVAHWVVANIPDGKSIDDGEEENHFAVLISIFVNSIQNSIDLSGPPFEVPRYMDMYRDPKEVEQELLEERLRRAQLDDYQAPKWLDPTYNENKKELPAWQHCRILAREGRYRALYNNALKS
nr:phosphatidylethanolamine-binding protein [Haemonchus contortus]